jgi:predicted dehydrogenase
MDLVNDPNIDAIVLAMPTSDRFELARATLMAGKHLLIEKPAAMNGAELKQLVPLAKDRVVACASSRFRYSPVGKAFATILKSYPVGKLRLLQVRASVPASIRTDAPPAWRLNRSLNGGGILVNWGVYDLDFLVGSLDWSLQPLEVMAAAWPIMPDLSKWVAAGSDAETHVKAMIRFRNGVVLDYERAEFNSGKPEFVWRMTGDQGTLEVPMLGGDQCCITLSEVTPDGLVEHELWRQCGPNPDVHFGPVNDFVDAIVDCRPPLTGLRQAIALTQLTDMIYESAETGRAVISNET